MKSVFVSYYFVQIFFCSSSMCVMRLEYLGKHLSFNTQKCVFVRSVYFTSLPLFAYMLLLCTVPPSEHKFYIVFTQEIDSLSFSCTYSDYSCVVIYFCFIVIFFFRCLHSHLAVSTIHGLRAFYYFHCFLLFSICPLASTL